MPNESGKFFYLFYAFFFYIIFLVVKDNAMTSVGGMFVSKLYLSSMCEYVSKFSKKNTKKKLFIICLKFINFQLVSLH